jgi:AcrR family transcriptional regulator
MSPQREHVEEAITEQPKRRGRPPAGGREAILAAALGVIRERGIARLTAREVAALAGVSEASVFYHYKDRFGLLQAVFEEGLRPLRALAEGGIEPGADPRSVLTLYGHTLEDFLDGALPVIAAAQSDSELRDSMAAYMAKHDLGPQRGVRAIGGYLAAEQAAGRARADIDPYAVAMMFIGACYTRSSQRQMPLPTAKLPALEDIVEAAVAAVAPVAPVAE